MVDEPGLAPIHQSVWRLLAARKVESMTGRRSSIDLVLDMVLAQSTELRERLTEAEALLDADEAVFRTTWFDLYDENWLNLRERRMPEIEDRTRALHAFLHPQKDESND